MTPRSRLEFDKEAPNKNYSASQMRKALFDLIPSEIDRIRAERTGQTIPQRKITAEYKHV